MQNLPSSSSFQEAIKSTPIVIQEEDPGKSSEPAETQLGDSPKGKEPADHIEDPLELGEIPRHREASPTDLASPLNNSNADPLLLETDRDEESDEGDSSCSLPTVPFKNPRGRKSKKKQREEASYLEILEGSQKTLKGLMNTISKKGSGPASKGATPPHRF